MIPAFQNDGLLPPGLHGASLREVRARFGGNARREEQLGLLRAVVEAALVYPSIKRVLIWGSFVSSKDEPNDLDYSLVVGVEHKLVTIAPEHERFLVPRAARVRYGVDVNYLVIEDYDLEHYAMLVDFVMTGRDTRHHGVVEVSLRGETHEEIFD